MKRITLITQFFPPDYAATGQLLEGLTNKLSELNLKFTILCGMPHYAFQKNNVDLYEFKKNRTIIRTRISRFFKKNFLGRIFNGFLFSLNIIYNLIFILPKSDLYIFTTEPPFAPFISMFSNLIRKTKFIIIIYDSYPNILFENKLISKRNILIKIWLFINKYVYSNADRIITLSSPMAEKFIEDYPYTKNKISVIPSWADIEKIKPLSKGNNWFVDKYKLKEKFVILYSGNQGRCHDFKTILDTSLLLKDNPRILFLFIGNGYHNKLIKEFKKKHRLSNIKLLDYQAFDDLPFSLTSADLALVSMSENAGNLIAPSKLYGHLASGTPIAVISPSDSYLEELVITNNLGQSFKNGESQKFKDWIINLENNQELKKNFSQNSRRFIVKNFSEKIITQKYFEIINQILNII